MNTLFDALKTGWTVSTVANVLAHGNNDEGRGFLVTLVEPEKHLLYEVYLPYSIETESMLSRM